MWCVLFGVFSGFGGFFLVLGGFGLFWFCLVGVFCLSVLLPFFSFTLDVEGLGMGVSV